MRRRMPQEMGMLALGPYRFIRYTNNLGLVVEVEDKVGMVQKVSSSHFLTCLSMPKQVQIAELPIDIIDEDVVGCLMGKASPIKPLEPPVDGPSSSGCPAALAGGAEWFSSSSTIMLSDSDDELLPSMVQWHDNTIALHLSKRMCPGSQRFSWFLGPKQGKLVQKHVRINNDKLILIKYNRQQ